VYLTQQHRFTSVFTK